MSDLGTYSVETPESVEVRFDLAGPGSRFCALLYDWLILFLILFVVMIGACVAGLSLDPLDVAYGGPWRDWGWAFTIVVAVVLLFGYHAIFELLMNGQTPGKRSMQIRVIRDDGTPATALDLVMRNLIRLVDMLPGFYVVGGVCAALHPQHKRLGDLAAGTLVVKEAPPDYRAVGDRKQPEVPVEMPVTYGALSTEEQRLVRGFLQRRPELLAEARARLAAALAMQLHERHGGDMSDPEAYLERLAAGHHHDA